MSNPLEESSPLVRALYENEARRVAQMYLIYKHLERGEIDLPNVYVGKIIQRAETSGLVALLIKKGVTTADEFLRESAEQMAAITDATERELNVLITTDGVHARKNRGWKDGGPANQGG